MTRVNPFNVLIVDDVIKNIELAINILKEQGYNLFYALTGKQAIQMLEAEPTKFDFVLLDVMMPEMNGFDTCKHLKANPQTVDIPIIFVTAKSDTQSMSTGFSVGGIDYITKPFHPDELLIKVKNHLTLHQAKHFLKQHNIDLEQKLTVTEQRYITDLEETQHELILMLTAFIENTSYETGLHVRRMSELAARLAHHHPDMNEKDENTLFHAAPLHDLGKLTIPQEILHKTGAFTATEYEIMKSHTINGYNMLKISSRPLFSAAASIALEHHERWDGTGYPYGLKGSDIHIYARIVSLVDVLDALTHARSYKRAWSFEEAIDYIKELKGLKFDPELVDLLVANQEEFREFCVL